MLETTTKNPSICWFNLFCSRNLNWTELSLRPEADYTSGKLLTHFQFKLDTLFMHIAGQWAQGDLIICEWMLQLSSAKQNRMLLKVLGENEEMANDS